MMTFGHWTSLNPSNMLSRNHCILALIIILSPTLTVESALYGCKPCQSARSTHTKSLPPCLHSQFMLFPPDRKTFALQRRYLNVFVSWPSDPVTTVQVPRIVFFLSLAYILNLQYRSVKPCARGTHQKETGNILTYIYYVRTYCNILTERVLARSSI